MSNNVWTKLANARVQLQNMNLKKSGENKFAGYEYFELCDFLPQINEIFSDVGLFGLVSFTHENASLTIINTEKPDEQIVFNSPMASANLKGCHDIQNMGAVETYQRRYLYTMALEIVEHDPIDKTMNPDDAKTSQKAPQQAQEPRKHYEPSKKAEPPKQDHPNVSSDAPKISDKQKGFLRAKVTEYKIPNDVFMKMLSKYGTEHVSDLTTKQMNELITTMQAYMPVPVNDDLPF